MFDSFSKKNNLILVIDQINSGILAVTKSVPIANAVSRGMLNSSVFLFWSMSVPEEFKNYSLNTKSNYAVVKKKQVAMTTNDVANPGRLVESTNNNLLFDVTAMSTIEISSDWINRRSLANKRTHAFTVLENKLERYLARTKNFFADDIFMSFMQRELDLCQPDLDYYTTGVQEWADILGLPADQAYQELSFKISSTQISVSRIHALWEKYTDLINSTEEKSQMINYLNENLEMELRSGAR